MTHAGRIVSPAARAGAQDSVPLWRRGLASGDVFTIAGTENMNGVGIGKPAAYVGSGGPSGGIVIDDWCGLAFGPTFCVSWLGGGHDQYPLREFQWENSAYLFDYMRDVPRWAMRHIGSRYEARRTGFAHYADGFPCSRHTYYSLQYHARLNKVFAIGCMAPYGTYRGFEDGPDAHKSHVDAFDLTSNLPDSADTYARVALAGVNWAYYGIGAAMVTHPVTGEMHVTSLARFAKFDPADGTRGSWRPYVPLLGGVPAYLAGEPSWQYEGALIDARRNCLVTIIADGASPHRMRLHRVNLSTLELTRHTITGAYTTPTPCARSALPQEKTLVHDLDGDRYVCWHGANLFSVHPDTFESALAANSATFEPLNGTHNRMGYMQALGGIGFLPDGASPMHFLATR